MYKPSAGANSRGKKVFPSTGAEQNEKEQGEVVVLTLLVCPTVGCKWDLIFVWDFML